MGQRGGQLGLVGACPNREIHRRNQVCPRRGAENGNTLLIHGGPRRNTENGETFPDPRRGVLRGDAAGLHLSQIEWRSPNVKVT